ncbi:hypothetical protein ST47_g4406 [Ascochyta rabiei]|uniref:Rhodopsin domain-containing protein n=1 Tax=Didymella rabiei TaxID=5454 RepID=A0A163FMU9_DIDRA|nr:hypothetical protein ST47_g4406 [Ascochyta rabiei]
MSAMVQEGHRWARVTPNDHSGILYIVTFVGFTYTSLTFLTRILIKWQVLGLDDAAMLVAQIASVVQFSLLLASLSSGLARSFESITAEQYSRMASTYSSGQVVLYISLGFSKISTILLVRRLFIRDMKNAWAMCNLITGAMVIWTIVSAVLVLAGCTSDSLSPKTPSDICNGIEVRYMFVVITDGVTDLILAFIPSYLCRHLQMNILFKLQVLGLFALRLPLVVLAGLFYHAWRTAHHSDNPGVERTASLVYQQSQLCFSLIAATIPCLKSFIQGFDTGSGQKAGFGYSSNSGAYGHMSSVHHSSSRFDNGESYQMSRLDRDNDNTSRLRKGGGSEEARIKRKSFVAEGGATTMDGNIELERCSTQESDRKSQQSTQELFIRKDVQFEVKREPAKKHTDTHQPGLLRLPK